MEVEVKVPQNFYYEQKAAKFWVVFLQMLLLHMCFGVKHKLLSLVTLEGWMPKGI
jgi:hypothetical protein